MPFFHARQQRERERVYASLARAPTHSTPPVTGDIAWAGALATHAHTERRPEVWAAVLHEDGWFDGKDFHPYNAPEATMTREQEMLLTNDPSIWKTVYRY